MIPDSSLWTARHGALIELCAKQLFFIGAAPRSGTTWLQLLLDAHPEVSCRGEGQFGTSLLPHLKQALEAHNAYLANKNATVFQETEGYPLFGADDLEYLLGAAILLALRRHPGAASCKAVGEKTPHNLRIFDGLRRLFPPARFIHLLRDPREVLVSSWHHNARLDPSWADRNELQGFVRDKLATLAADTHAGLAFGTAHPDSYLAVTYETLVAAPLESLARVFRFLGVSDAPETVHTCIDAAAFERLSGGRRRGEPDARSLFRNGLPGDWRGVLSEATNRFVVEQAGWMLRRFGWPEVTGAPIRAEGQGALPPGPPPGDWSPGPL